MHTEIGCKNPSLRTQLNVFKVTFQSDPQFSSTLTLFIFQSNVTIRVIAPENKISQADFALDQAIKITENYERFFGIDYPLPKQGIQFFM